MAPWSGAVTGEKFSENEIMKLALVITALCIPCTVFGADLTFEEAVSACKAVYPSTHSESDDGNSTFPSEDRVNVALKFKELGLVCSVGKTSREVEQVRAFSGKIFSKHEIKEILQERVAREQSIARVASGDYADFIREAKTNVTANFKDPSSAQFRNLYLSKKTFPTLCGEVNAKNSYGAYVGFRGFIYNSVTTLIDDGKELGEGFIYRRLLADSCAEKFADVD